MELWWEDQIGKRSKQNVVVMFRTVFASGKGKAEYAIMSSSLINSSMFLMQDICDQDMIVYFSQSNIDISKTKIKKVLESPSGSHRTKVYSVQEYAARYQYFAKNKPLNPFVIPVRIDTIDSQVQGGSTLRGVHAEVIVRPFFAGKTRQSNNSSYFSTVRDSSEVKDLIEAESLSSSDLGLNRTFNFKKYSQSHPGFEPKLKVFLEVPVISRKEREIVGTNKLSRFNNGPVWNSQSVANYINKLGLPYNTFSQSNDAFKFCTLQVRIVDIEEIHVSGRNQIETEHTGNRLRDMLQLRPDFFFEKSFLCERIVSAACEEADKHKSQEMIDLFNKMFPLNEDDEVPLEVVVDKVKKNNQAAFEIRDISTGLGFDSGFKTGGVYNLALIDRYSGKTIPGRQLSVPATVRGIDVNAMPEQMAKSQIRSKAKEIIQKRMKDMQLLIHRERGGTESTFTFEPQIHVVAVGISEAKYIDQNGVESLIKPEEIDPLSDRHIPSRQVSVNYSGESRKLGNVEDVPKKPKKPSGKSRGRMPGTSKPTYSERHEDIPIRYGGENGIVQLNKRWTIYRDYMMFVAKHRSIRGQELVNDFYREILKMARTFYHTLTSTMESPKVNETAIDQQKSEGLDWSDDFYDFPINDTISRYVHESPQIQQILKKLKYEKERVCSSEAS
jgi:hypothetical protein